MTEPPSIFRQEALESYAAGKRGSGELLRLDSRWLRWSYWGVLGLVVAGLVMTVLIRTDATTTGPAVLKPDGTFAALIPAVVAPQLKGAGTMRIESVGGADRVRATAIVDHVEPADDAAASRAGLPPPQQPSILLSGTLDEPESSAVRPPTEVRGRAIVVLRSEPVFQMFARRLGAMLG